MNASQEHLIFADSQEKKQRAHAEACALCKVVRRQLKVNLSANLNITRIMPSVDRTEACAVVDAGIDRTRVAVIERIEGFKTELQGDPFCESYVLDQRHIPDL